MTPRARPLPLFATLALACLITTPLVAQTSDPSPKSSVTITPQDRIMNQGYYERLGTIFEEQGPVILTSFADVIAKQTPGLDFARLVIPRPARAHILDHAEEDINRLRAAAQKHFHVTDDSFAGLALTRTQAVLYFIPPNKKTLGAGRFGSMHLDYAQPEELDQLETIDTKAQIRFLLEIIVSRETELRQEIRARHGTDYAGPLPLSLMVKIKGKSEATNQRLFNHLYARFIENVDNIDQRTAGDTLELVIAVDFDKEQASNLLSTICKEVVKEGALCYGFNAAPGNDGDWNDGGPPEDAAQSAADAAEAPINSDDDSIPDAIIAADVAVASPTPSDDGTFSDAAGTSNDPHDLPALRGDVVIAELTRTIDGQSAKDPVMLVIYPDYLARPEGTLIRATMKRPEKFEIFDDIAAWYEIERAVIAHYGLKDWQPVATQISEDRSVLYFKTYPGKTYPFGTRDNITLAPVSNEEAARLTSIPIADHIRGNIRIGTIMREEMIERDPKLEHYTMPLYVGFIAHSQPQAVKDRLLARLKSRYETLGTTIVSESVRDYFVVGAGIDFDPDTVRKLLTGMCEIAKAENVPCIAIITDRDNSQIPRLKDRKP